MNASSLLGRDASKYAAINSHLKDQVEQLLMLLSQRERFVIERRFALDLPQRLTLEEIGQHFSVTRERVRQIEKNALQKLTRNVGNFDIFEINNRAYELLTAQGGLLSEDRMISRLLQENHSYAPHALLFILSLDKRFIHLSNTIKYHPYFRLAEIPEALIDKVSHKCLQFLQKKGDTLPIEQLYKMAVPAKDESHVLDLNAFESLFPIHKAFKVIDDRVGLISWKHIHPRTLRDKIYFVLRSKKDPMHFVDIANAIVDAQFDRKNVNLQAVHNELIRHSDFILIGRGIYALKEWGFSSGTVAEIITSILKGKDQLSEQEIIEEVLKQRQVKPITIILNLKNKPRFIRVGRKRYALKK